MYMSYLRVEGEWDGCTIKIIIIVTRARGAHPPRIINRLHGCKIVHLTVSLSHNEKSRPFPTMGRIMLYMYMYHVVTYTHLH